MKADSIEVECKWKSINSVRSIAVLIYNNSVKCDFIRLNGIDATMFQKCRIPRKHIICEHGGCMVNIQTLLSLTHGVHLDFVIAFIRDSYCFDMLRNGC